MSDPMNQAAAGRELVDTEAQLDVLEKRRARLLEPITAQLRVLTARRTALRAALPGLMRANSSKSLAIDDDGIALGSISLLNGAWKAEVTDAVKLAEWVAERYPGEVETVTVVRPAFLKKLQDGAKAAGDPVDRATGEVIPGLAVAKGDPYVSTTPTAAARDRAADLLAIPVEPEALVVA